MSTDLGTQLWPSATAEHVCLPSRCQSLGQSLSGVPPVGWCSKFGHGKLSEGGKFGPSLNIIDTVYSEAPKKL